MTTRYDIATQDRTIPILGWCEVCGFGVDGYPIEWPSISLAIREAVNWRCQACGVECNRPGEKSDKPQLTVAHLNHIKADVRPGNLKALCWSCHKKQDTRRRRVNPHRKCVMAGVRRIKNPKVAPVRQPEVLPKSPPKPLAQFQAERERVEARKSLVASWEGRPISRLALAGRRGR